jgi:hypothetical protein
MGRSTLAVIKWDTKFCPDYGADGVVRKRMKEGKGRREKKRERQR